MWQVITYAVLSTPRALWSSERRSPAGPRRERQSPAGLGLELGREEQCSGTERREMLPKGWILNQRFSGHAPHTWGGNGADGRCRRCRDTQRQRAVFVQGRRRPRPRPGSDLLPRAAGGLGAAGGGGPWVIKDATNLRFRSSLSESSLFLEGFSCPCGPVCPGPGPAGLQRGDLCKECCCLLVMHKHYLLVKCNTVQERIFRLAYFTSFGLISLCIIVVLICLVLKAFTVLGVYPSAACRDGQPLATLDHLTVLSCFHWSRQTVFLQALWSGVVSSGLHLHASSGMFTSLHSISPHHYKKKSTLGYPEVAMQSRKAK